MDALQNAVLNLKNIVNAAKGMGEPLDPVLDSLMAQILRGSDAKTIEGLAKELASKVNPYTDSSNAIRDAARAVAKAATTIGLSSELDWEHARADQQWNRGPGAGPGTGVARPQKPVAMSPTYEESIGGASLMGGEPLPNSPFFTSSNSLKHEGKMSKAHKIAMAAANKAYEMTMNKLGQGELPGGTVSFTPGKARTAPKAPPGTRMSPNKTMSLRDALRTNDRQYLLKMHYAWQVAKTNKNWNSAQSYWREWHNAIVLEYDQAIKDNIFPNANAKAEMDQALIETVKSFGVPAAKQTLPRSLQSRASARFGMKKVAQTIGDYVIVNDPNAPGGRTLELDEWQEVVENKAPPSLTLMNGFIAKKKDAFGNPVQASKSVKELLKAANTLYYKYLKG